MLLLPKPLLALGALPQLDQLGEHRRLRGQPGGYALDQRVHQHDALHAQLRRLGRGDRGLRGRRGRRRSARRRRGGGRGLARGLRGNGRVLGFEGEDEELRRVVGELPAHRLGLRTFDVREEHAEEARLLQSVEEVRDRLGRVSIHVRQERLTVLRPEATAMGRAGQPGIEVHCHSDQLVEQLARSGR